MKYVICMIIGGTMVAGSFVAGLLSGVGLSIYHENKENKQNEY